MQGMNIQACDGAGRELLDRVVDTARRAWPTAGPTA